MKNRATLYTLEQTPVQVSGEYFEMTRIPPLRAYDGNFLTLMDATVTIEHVPVHCIHTIKRGGAIQDDYIVIAPELHRILNMPYEESLLKAHRKQLDAEMLADTAQGVIQKFNALSWYKRVWVALIGGLK